jgi:hypothetical protein
VIKLKTSQLGRIVLLTQGIGAIFFVVFLASYTMALPSNRVLHGEAIFKIPISIFGSLFLILTISLLIFSFVWKRKNSA